MFDLAQFAKDPNTRKILLGVAVFGATLFILHKMKQIELTNLQIQDYKAK